MLYGTKKSRFFEQQKEKGLLSNLAIRTTLSKISILGEYLF